MATRVRVFQFGNGSYITQLRVATARSWVIPKQPNDIGECVFEMAVRDPKCREDTLQYGNYLLVEHDSLPAWVGIIECATPGRSWGYRTLTVRALSAEHVLITQPTPIAVAKGTAGGIVMQILNYYNAQADWIVQPGNIYVGGSDRQETLGDSAFEHIRAVANRSGNEWEVAPLINVNGQLELRLNFYNGPRGVDTGLYLSNTKKLGLKTPQMEEQAEEDFIWNIIHAYNDASSSASRLEDEVQDDGSVGLYGRRRKNMVFYGIKTAAGLRESALAYLNLHAYPVQTMQPTILNVNNLFQNTALGNLYRMTQKGTGFRNGAVGNEVSVRATGIGFDDTKPKQAELVVEVQRGS